MEWLKELERRIKMENLKFNVEQFKKDYYSGTVCLFGDKNEIDNFIGNYNLPYNHRLEERDVLDHSFKTYIACVDKDKYTFEQLLACREIEICRLKEIYPVREIKNNEDNKIEVLSRKDYCSIRGNHFKAGKRYEAKLIFDAYKIYEGQLEVKDELGAWTSFSCKKLFNSQFASVEEVRNNKLQYNSNQIEASKETYWVIKETNLTTGKESTNKYTDRNQAIDSYDARCLYYCYNDIKRKIELIEVDAVTTYESRLLKDCK